MENDVLDVGMGGRDWQEISLWNWAGAGSFRGLSVMPKYLEFILKSLESYSRASCAS